MSTITVDDRDTITVTHRVRYLGTNTADAHDVLTVLAHRGARIIETNQ
jgi:hypothetical protein